MLREWELVGLLGENEMRAPITLLVAVLLAVMAPGCGKGREEAFVKEALKITEEKAEILSKLKTADDVKERKGALEKLNKRVKKLEERRDEYRKKLRRKHEDRIEEAERKIRIAKKDMSSGAREELKKLELYDEPF